VPEKTIALPTEVPALKNLRIKVEIKKEKIDRIMRGIKGIILFIPLVVFGILKSRDFH
jgi:hypothetical protein